MNLDQLRALQAVAREVGDELPLYVQVTSGGAGGPVTAEDSVKLGDSIPNSFAVKAEPVPLGPFITTVHRESQGRIALYTGNQGIDLYEALDRGAVGVMPGCSMVGVYERIVREFLQGSKDTAFDLYNRLVPYLNAFHGPHELAFEKRILAKRGIFKTPFCRSGGGGGEMDAYTEAYLWKYYDYLREQFPQEIA
jgi:4-hydroxy-tetrahydrodipicolinate synthase